MACHNLDCPLVEYSKLEFHVQNHNVHKYIVADLDFQNSNIANTKFTNPLTQNHNVENDNVAHRLNVSTTTI